MDERVGCRDGHLPCLPFILFFPSFSSSLPPPVFLKPLQSIFLLRCLPFFFIFYSSYSSSLWSLTSYPIFFFLSSFLFIPSIYIYSLSFLSSSLPSSLSPSFSLSLLQFFFLFIPLIFLLYFLPLLFSNSPLFHHFPSSFPDTFPFLTFLNLLVLFLLLFSFQHLTYYILFPIFSLYTY